LGQRTRVGPSLQLLSQLGKCERRNAMARYPLAHPATAARPSTSRSCEIISFRLKRRRLAASPRRPKPSRRHPADRGRLGLPDRREALQARYFLESRASLSARGRCSRKAKAQTEPCIACPQAGADRGWARGGERRKSRSRRRRRGRPPPPSPYSCRRSGLPARRRSLAFRASMSRWVSRIST
jgi:hypothetical protein